MKKTLALVIGGLVLNALAFSPKAAAQQVDAVGVAQRYFASFKDIAAQVNNSRAADFEAYCRIFNESFDIAYGVKTFGYYINVYYSSPPPASMYNFLIGDIVTYALYQANFFQKARANLGALAYIQQGNPTDVLVNGVRGKAVTFKAFPTADPVTITINTNTGKVMDLSTSAGLLKSAGNEMRAKLSVTPDLGEALNKYISDTLGTTQYNNVGCP